MAVSWTKNWDRAYRITLGTREYTDTQYTLYREDIIKATTSLTATTSTTIPSDAKIMGNVVADGFDKRGFSFKFDSTQGLAKQSSGSEKTTLTLYNLNDEMVTLINKDKCKVIVEAGYEDSVEVAYTGDVTRVRKSRQGADTVYTLSCTSGGFTKRNTIGTLSYDECMSDKDVITDFIYRFGDTSAGTVGLSDYADVYKTGGRFFSGSLIEEFEKLLASKNLLYAHINGKIVIVPKSTVGSDYDTFARTNYNLPENALKSVKYISDKTGVGSDDSTSSRKQLQVNTFFIPVEMAQFITIPETDYTEDTYGTYLVKGRRIVLDSMGSAWDISLKVEEIT